MKVSIGIPFHRESLAHFKLAVGSVFAQSYSDWELILISDGARQDLIDAARAIDDERVRVELDGKNLGLAARLNQAIGLSTGDIVARMDADDVMFPDRIERQVRFLAESVDVDVVGTRIVAIDGDNYILGSYRPDRRFAGPEDVAASPRFSHPSVAGRRVWFDVHRYNESLMRAEDKELWLRTAESSTFADIEEPTLFYRIPSEFNRAKAMTSTRADRTVTVPFVRANIGHLSAAKYWMNSSLKEVAYTVAGDILWERIRDRRIRPIATAERNLYQARLNQVMSLEVPGWV